MQIQNPYAGWRKKSVEEHLVHKWMYLRQLRRSYRFNPNSIVLESAIVDAEFSIILLQECL